MKTRNLPWSKDEIILALDLYFDPHRGGISSTNPKIIELSILLNKLKATEVINNAEKFRNPNGVCLKLSNFLSIDPKHNGKGMSKCSKLDRELFEKYDNNFNLLKTESNEIKGKLK